MPLKFVYTFEEGRMKTTCYYVPIFIGEAGHFTYPTYAETMAEEEEEV